MPHLYREHKNTPLDKIYSPVYYTDLPDMFGLSQQRIQRWFYDDKLKMPVPMADGWDPVAHELVWTYSSLLRWGKQTGRLDETGHCVGMRKRVT